jgi:hypothetical protein
MHNESSIPLKLQSLIQESLCPVLIMGNLAFFDYELIPLDDGLDGRDWRPRSGRPSECLGVLGIVDGVSRSALVAPLDSPAVKYIVGLYASHVKRANEAEQSAAAGPEPKPEGDGVAWLDALYRLPDTRG